MSKRPLILIALIAALLSAWAASSVAPSAQASPSDDYVGPYFGDGNLPPGCIVDRSRDNPANVCYHGKVGLNALDSPKIDVAVLVPASPTAERDLRIMRQAAEAWDGGIHYLAEEMGLDWLADNVTFHISPDVVSLAEGDEVSTYPLYDPEIVILATNPAGGAGIGVDPTYLTDSIGLYDENGTPCHDIPNPFSLDTWEGMPGYDGHHGDGGGFYVEDCGGAGGNVCFSVNGGVDPVPGTTDAFSLFDLVLHETGHCLTLGHVGDGAETPVWGPVPTTDIMAYSYDPPGQNKCVSTLNVEAFATRMSNYVDVDGDGAVSEADHLSPNDALGDGANGFQVMHPDDHHFASSTGSVWDCPQPDLGTLPGTPTDWTPTPVETSTPVLTVTEPEHGAETADGHVHVSGTVERRSLEEEPTATSVAHSDAEGDATSDLTDIQNLQVEVSALEVTATVKVKELWPSGVASLPQFSVSIGGRQFDSKISETGTVITADHSAEVTVPSEWSAWDASAGTVTFHIPRSYLADASVTAPYDVFAISGYTTPNKIWTVVQDDRAPDSRWVSVAAPEASDASTSGTTTPDGSGGQTAAATLSTVVLEQPGGNTFTVADTSAGALANADHFTLDVPTASDVELVLAWGDGSDLDMTVSGAGSGTSASSNNPERVLLRGVQGRLDIDVDPYLIVGVPSTTYTLEATIVPASSGGGAGTPPTPSEMPANETVTVYVDGVEAASQEVESSHGPAGFALEVSVPTGSHDLTTVWRQGTEILASDVRTVIHAAPGVDRDGDGDADSADNCLKVPNADQADLDRDDRGDVCDADIDGDGYSNDKEQKAGTDPYDATSYPRRSGGTRLR